MNVLIACESSGIIREAFRAKGHNAWSCDLEETEIPTVYHYIEDARYIIDYGCGIYSKGTPWDLLIAHPPCTYLSVSGNRWMNDKVRYPNRDFDRQQAISFFMEMINSDVDKVCIENPVGIMNTRYRKPDQIIQPYQFGHTEAKKTCLWLKNLPLLIPTEIVEPEYVTFKSGKKMAKWYSNAHGDRSKERSRTFTGIAEAMADQWR